VPESNPGGSEIFCARPDPGPKAYTAFYTMGKGKGKTIPLKAWTGPEGSRRLRLPNFKKIGT